jgi:hypothetical protein
VSAVLSKTVSLLDRAHPEDWEDREYWAVDPDTGLILRSVSMDIQTFVDLGEPAQITVTIEPGDTLN